MARYSALRGDTRVRLMPPDGIGARAIARWLVETSVGEVLVVHDHEDGYGIPVGTMCAHAASEAGESAHAARVGPRRALAGRSRRRGGAAYVGAAGSGAVGMWRDSHGAQPDMWLVGSEGVAEEWRARETPPGAAARTRFFVAHRAPFALHGLEAMALILDAIGAGGGECAATAAAARATRDRDSVLGAYSIDRDGHTTTTAYGRLAVVDGRLARDLSSR